MGALGDAYATNLELADRVGVSEPAVWFDEFLDVASRAVEGFTGRQFNKTTVATPRRFRPVDWWRLPVDDFHTVTDLAVTVDGTAWDLANVDPRPWNGIVNGQPGWPFSDLVAVNRTWSTSPTAVFTVTAQWGWAAVPEAIRQATLDVAATMVSAGGSSYPVRAEAVAGYSVTYQLPSSDDAEVPPELVKALRYRRKRFGVA